MPYTLSALIRSAPYPVPVQCGSFRTTEDLMIARHTRALLFPVNPLSAAGERV